MPRRRDLLDDIADAEARFGALEREVPPIQWRLQNVREHRARQRSQVDRG
jgi:hypothetical protein